MVETGKFAMMFIDIFIPYTFLVYMVIGGKSGITKKSDYKRDNLESFSDIV